MSPARLNLRPVVTDCGKMTEEHEVLTTDEATGPLRVSTKTVLTPASFVRGADSKREWKGEDA